MRILLTILFIGIFGVYAQEPAYTPMKSNYKFKGIRVDSLFLIPSFADTFSANNTYLEAIPGAMIRCGNDFWMRNAATTAWLQNVNIGPDVSPIVNFVNKVFKKVGTDSVYYIIAPSDTFFAYKDVGYDTTSLSIRINQKIDSLKRTNDSIYFKVNGGWVFGYKDSTGGTQNFANSNLIATGNRTHNFRSKYLVIDSTNYTYIYAKEGAPNYHIGTLSLLPYEGGISSQNTNGDQTGFYYDMQNNNVAIMNKNNIAWMSKRLFLEDTIAMLSDLVGLSKTDSPDRINGTATNEVNSNFNGKSFILGNIDILKANGNSIGFEGKNIISTGFSMASSVDTVYKVYKKSNLNSLYIKIDTLGNSYFGDINGDGNKLTINIENQISFKSKKPMMVSDNNYTSEVLTGYYKNNLDLSASNYTIPVPGVYKITTASGSYSIGMPNVSDYAGQSVTIINITTTDQNISDITNPDGNPFTSLQGKHMITAYSDGTKWYCIKP